MTTPETPPGWYPDPFGGHQHRYWDGSTWTEQVADQGVAHAEVATLPEPEPEPEPEPVRQPVLIGAGAAGAAPAAAPEPVTSAGALIVVLLAGLAVSLFFGLYARIHEPASQNTVTLWFSDSITMKVWFATVAVVLAAVQMLTAARLYGRITIPRHTPAWLGDIHRLSGLLAFLFTLPVAFHCLFVLGFRSDVSDLRTYIHSVVGCAFYGLFVVKVLSVRLRDLPGWLLPATGILTFAALGVLWTTSSLWYWGWS